jgi:diguanylate cyclase (GGDEF)-like protein
MARAMKQKHILILHPLPSELDRVSELASAFGPVLTATSLESLGDLLRGASVRVAVMDAGLARYHDLRDHIRPKTAVILTGGDEGVLRRTAEEWPAGFYIDLFVTDPDSPRERSFLRALERALEQARIRSEAEELQRSLAQHESKVRDVYAEIQEIKGLINSNFLQEIEKRIAIETKYVWFQKERQRIEAILRKIYASDDVSSLLDVLPDMRDIVSASSATVYIIEENEVIGRYLKPLVWDNAYLPHAEFSKYIALWDSQDFAATVARYGQGFNGSELAFDRRMTKRYTEYLRAPLKSLVAVPIMHSRKVIGVVEVYNKTVQGKPIAEGFSREDQQILQGISEHMAIAMIKLNLIQYDALTGLLRPEPFFEKVLQKVNAPGKRRREEGDSALVMGDVDWFKDYNDRNGHEAGNRLLRELAHILKLSIREEDLLCRYGGEEFLFFLTGVKNPGEAAVLTDRIRKNVEDHYFEFQEFQPQHNLTMSFGVTVFPTGQTDYPPPLTKSDLKRLAAEADTAMAEAKGKRRPDMKGRAGEDAALTKNRVSMYFGGLGAGRARAEVRPDREWVLRERRKHERLKASTLVMIKENAGFKVAKTVNLSVGGARVISDERLPVAKTMDIILVLGDKANPVKGDVIYSEKPEGETAFFYSGLKFIDLSPEEIRELEDYLFRFRRKGSFSA